MILVWWYNLGLRLIPARLPRRAKNPMFKDNGPKAHARNVFCLSALFNLPPVGQSAERAYARSQSPNRRYVSCTLTASTWCVIYTLLVFFHRLRSCSSRAGAVHHGSLRWRTPHCCCRALGCYGAEASFFQRCCCAT